ncbi:MAG: peptidoglycan DD-metalloendopeptidase family protein [Bacteroidales bacterium]|nr:peptidoglycan DD-metalloendopeptidase family protein [Bacteroidales bacterium]
MKTTNLKQILQKHTGGFSPVTPFDIREKKLCYIDLSDKNTDLTPEDIEDNEVFGQYIQKIIESNNADLAIGKYNENRTIYRKSEHFTPKGEEPRSIHLGTDLWLQTGTAIHAPLSAKVHSFQNNDNYGDYGPTIILEHHLDGQTFFTLYGHLNLNSLKNIHQGQYIEQGKTFCNLGNPNENGQWPAHLHFQIISNMMNKKGDFPGVAKPSEKQEFLEICPDPGLILGIKTH